MSNKKQFRAVRLPEALNAGLAKEARQRGFANASALIRAAIQKELKNDGGSTGNQADERIAASFDRLAREIRRVGNAQQALFAFTDALARVLLHCLPEPVAASHDQALARAKERHNRLLKMAALSMQGDSRAALLELIDRGDQ